MLGRMNIWGCPINQMNDNRQQGSLAPMQSNHPLEEPILGDNLDSPIEQTHTNPSWDQLLRHITTLIARQQRT
ncbi:5709_t:CDS:1 [Racocetra persica]|uniref:5709_t:CDS:1 n=1 Tax=Racocetra persica TaxID=160502 RepID=A0ACA9LEV9_9GLOM|nr:5709_t:CDS:1 [Racocetra persica]